MNMVVLCYLTGEESWRMQKTKDPGIDLLPKRRHGSYRSEILVCDNATMGGRTDLFSRTIYMY